MIQGKEFPVYYDSGTMVKQLEDLVLSNAFSIEPIEGGFNMKSLNKETTWVICCDDKTVCLGSKKMIDWDPTLQRIYNVDYIFEKWQDKDLLFISWDYALNKFKILDNPKKASKGV